MKSKIFMAVRILFAVFLLFFGSNKLLHFFDPPPFPDTALGYWDALLTTKTMTLVAIVEIVAGLSLLLNKYSGLMMIILMSVSINAVLYHLALDKANIGMAAGLLILNVIMLYHYKNDYKGLI